MKAGLEIEVGPRDERVPDTPTVPQAPDLSTHDGTHPLPPEGKDGRGDRVTSVTTETRPPTPHQRTTDTRLRLAEIYDDLRPSVPVPEPRPQRYRQSLLRCLSSVCTYVYVFANDRSH